MPDLWNEANKKEKEEKLMLLEKYDSENIMKLKTEKIRDNIWITLLITFVGLLIYSEVILVIIYIKTMGSMLTGVPWW